MSDSANDRDLLRLLPMDSAWLNLESPQNPLTITVLMRVSELTMPELTAFLQRYWLSWERFRMMPVETSRGWCWRGDPDFDLTNHLVEVDEVMDARRLQHWVSARLNEPLCRDRPRWGFWLVPRAEGSAALLFRIHHCYGDGMSLLAIFDSICTRTPQEQPQEFGGQESSIAARWPEFLQACRHAVTAGFRRWPSGDAGSPEKGSGDPGPEPSSANLLEQSLIGGLRAVNEISGMLTEPDDSPSSLNRSLLGRRHCRWSPPISQRRFLSLARRYGVSVNDVLLGCVTAAMRDGMGVAGTQLNQAVAHAAVPVDIRRSLPAALRPSSRTPGNFFGTIFVPLPVDGGFAQERLWRVKHETRRLKRSWQPAIAWGLIGLASVLPSRARQPIADLLYRKASAVVSNVPGTREPRYLAGHRVTEQMFWVPQAGEIGLGVSVVSYGGKVQFGVVADEAVLEDPDGFLARCLKELDDLGDALL